MGKSRTRKQAKALAQKGQNANAIPQTGPSKTQYPVADLLAKAEELLAQGEQDLCCQFCKRALQQEADNAAVLELLGSAELELGQVEEANEHFLHIVRTAGKDRPELSSAHLYLAQLVDTPQEAISHFQTALDLLRSRLDVMIPREQQASRTPASWSIEEAEIRRSSSRSLIGMTEVYMTDLCFEEDASSRCGAWTDLAIELDPTDPDALSTKASVLMSQERPDEAKKLVLASYALWADEEERPPVESRLKCARLLLECQLAEEAVEVLRGATDDEEENADAWYLLGVALGIIAEKGGEEAADFAIEAREALEACLALAAADDDGDNDEMFAHARELLDKLIAAGVPAPAEDEEWEDEDGDLSDDADAMQD